MFSINDPPCSPINDNLLISTQYLFGMWNLFSYYIESCMERIGHIRVGHMGSIWHYPRVGRAVPIGRYAQIIIFWFLRLLPLMMSLICSPSLEDLHFALRLRASLNDPPFSNKLKTSLKDPLFVVLTKFIFLLSLLKDPLLSIFSLSPKDPGGLVRTSPSLTYVSGPLPSVLLPWIQSKVS